MDKQDFQELIGREVRNKLLAIYNICNLEMRVSLDNPTIAAPPCVNLIIECNDRRSYHSHHIVINLLIEDFGYEYLSLLERNIVLRFGDMLYRDIYER